MRTVTALTLALAAVLAPSPAAGAQPSPSPGMAPEAAGLEAFDSCDSLVHYARTNALDRLEPALYGPPGAPPPAREPLAMREGSPGAAAGPEAFSGTNVQEAGVDEPDIVKTDGKHLFAISAGKLRAVDVSGVAPRRVDTLRIGSRHTDHDLLLRGDRLLVLSGSQDDDALLSRLASSVGVGPSKTVLSEVDVSNPSAMRLVRTLTVEGSYVSARLTRGTARVVLSAPASDVSIPGEYTLGAGEFQEARRRNREALARSPLSRWLPSYVLRDRRSRRKVTLPLADCRSVRRPTTFSGLDMLAVLTIDLDKGLAPTDADALMTDAETVYASRRSLYVATPRWVDEDMSAERQARGTTTQIHRFDVSAQRATSYRSSGRVRGFLLNQFSLSAHDGRLRVASTTEPVSSEGGRDRRSQSFVTVLAEEGRRLVRVGRVGGLGRGERIYSVRFMGDTGYVVTFREVDPLYTLDLSRPRSPRVLGALKIRGYSAYLHPAGDDLLIGVGQDATRSGRTLGTQLSLFDVSDLSRPRRLHRRTIAEATSEVEFDHHAFLWWRPARLAVVPVDPGFDEAIGAGAFTGAVAFRFGRGTGVWEAGRIAHWSGRGAWSVRRSIVVGNRLYTLSDAGVAANDVWSLTRLGFASFRRAPR
jgi:uncharacterized secreted protein with C-terminal beta-propeller domain